MHLDAGWIGRRRGLSDYIGWYFASEVDMLLSRNPGGKIGLIRYCLDVFIGDALDS